jgi:hypothetical protein
MGGILIASQIQRCRYCPARFKDCTCPSLGSGGSGGSGGGSAVTSRTSQYIGNPFNQPQRLGSWGRYVGEIADPCKCTAATNKPCCDCCPKELEISSSLNKATNPLSNNAITQAITESLGLNKYNQNYVDLRYNSDLSDAEPNNGMPLFNIGRNPIEEPIKQISHIESNITQVVVNDVFLTHNFTTKPGKIRIYNTMRTNPSKLMYGKIPILFMLSQPAQNYAKSLNLNDPIFRLYEKTGRIYHKKLSSNYAEKQSYIANISVEWLGIINSLPLSRISYTEHTYKMSEVDTASKLYSNTSKNNDNHALYARANVKARSAYYTGTDEEIFSAFVALQ